MVFCLCCKKFFKTTLVINSGNISRDQENGINSKYRHTVLLNPGVKNQHLQEKSPPVTAGRNKIQTETSENSKSVEEPLNSSTTNPKETKNEKVIVGNSQEISGKLKAETKKDKAPSRPISNGNIIFENGDLKDNTSLSTLSSTAKKDKAPSRPISNEKIRSESTDLEESISTKSNEKKDNEIITEKENKVLTNTLQEKKEPLKSSLKKDRAPSRPVSSGRSSLENVVETLETPLEDIYNTADAYIEIKPVENNDEESPKKSIDVPKESIDSGYVTNERREGVIPVPTKIDENIDKLPVHVKDPIEEALILKAIEKNDFINKIISKEQLKDVVAAMYSKDVSAKEVLIRQGDKGSEMYVSAKGTFQIIINGKTVDEFKDVRVFGELAILYNAQRLATIKAASSGRVWVLGSNVFQQIMVTHNIRKQDELMNFLVNNEYLNVVGNDALQIVANLLKTEFFISGQTIIKQGDRGDKFYIIRAGTVTITKDGEGVVGVYKKGDCFGELALLEEDARQATVTANAPGVECLTLTRTEFINHLGKIEKFKYIKVANKPKDSIKPSNSEFVDVNLIDLKIIKTLGVGGFGRVELVQHTKTETMVFALKYLKKIEIVEQNQQEHVYNEKRIQMNCRSPFIVRLYRTYKDAKYIYFLMESCLGGDLWSLLQRQKNRRFEEKEARYICACVLEAFDYLHSRGIVYRDLKPENLLIAKNGVIKLTDFGFAKKISGRGKTYTFAGTPEYVAPEIVLSRGHDRAVDYWAFGAFVFEMLSGRTPFRTDDSSHMRTYNKILKGIDNVPFPSHINLKARHLIEKLCRPVPAERLGMQRNGIQDVKTHKWFLGIDWVKLQKLEINSPFKPKLQGPTDTRYFDSFKKDFDIPPEEMSGWDEEF